MIWTPERKTLALAACARWQGTPHRDRIAVLGVGVDCIQFLKQVFLAAGVIEDKPITGYDVTVGLFEESDRIVQALSECLNVEQVPIGKIEFGDIVVFKTGRRAGHVGFYENDNLWHSLAGRAVTKSRFQLWRHEVQAVLRLRETGFVNDPNLSAKV